MSLTLVERPALTVTGLHLRTQPMSPDIPALWPRFMARVGEITRRTEPRVTYGVMQSDPADMARLDYWAAVAVDPASAVPDGMARVTLPAGAYALFRYPLSGLGAGFGEIFDKLLPASPYEQARGPLFERYNEAFDPADPASIVEVYLPVRPKGAA
ncbi:MAG: GyrI-like domain-containing protein [Rhizobacter sp.]|nr:GyrI-like domain-containing protein [Rhizobacter sp.]